jgi:hypothetical protein
MSPDEQTWSGIERRDPAGRQVLLRRFHDEYQHFPGMSLTADQAARLFAIRTDVCRRVFEELVHAGVLSRKWKDQYVAALGLGSDR